MLFNSWSFIAFFIVVLILHFALAHKWRIYLLLVASYFFYMSWKWEFGFLMLIVSLINFYAGHKINVGKQRRWWLALGLSTSLLPLLYYKYGNFLLDTFSQVSSAVGIEASFPELKVILPVGISFFTFQAMSYSIDIYRKKINAEPSPVKFLTFVAFFPQLVAGPIERSNHIIPQFDKVKRFQLDEFLAGMRLFIWGLFKKVVIADRLALYVDRIYDNPEIYSSATLTVATLFFAFQIYCDFSGYSDMAIGTARILGFRLMQNFNLPYLANSISDFWKRWHISLSTWFGDYLYIPMGGNRVPYLRWVFNIFVVFLVSGFWHGANWTFIVWGGLHAIYYIFENWGDQFLKWSNKLYLKKSHLYHIFKIITVFLAVCLAWIFFRASSLEEAVFISSKIIFFESGQLSMGPSAVTFVLSIALIMFLVVVQLLQYYKIASLYFTKSRVPAVLQFSGYLLLLLSIGLFGMSSNAFIYFQF